jgi:hypothetical protein
MRARAQTRAAGALTPASGRGQARPADARPRAANV